jgi:hypothetical protein
VPKEPIRDAKWEIAHGWENDVPHVILLAQCCSALFALGEPFPADWAGLFATGIATLETRSTSLGIETDGALFAALLRGMAALDIPPSAHWRDALGGILRGGRGYVTTVELAEAAMRHRELRPAAEPVVRDLLARRPAGPDEAAAAWWLSERARELAPSTLSPNESDELRRAVLAGRLTTGGKAAVMATEVLRTALDELVLVSPEEVETRTHRLILGTTIERNLWRALATVSVAMYIFANARPLTQWFSARLGQRGQVPTSTVQLAAAVPGYIAGASFAILIGSTIRMVTGKRPTLESWIVQGVGVLGAAVAYLFYPG